MHRYFPCSMTQYFYSWFSNCDLAQILKVYETSTWLKQGFANMRFDCRCELHNLFIHLIVFHAKQRVLWHLAQTHWDCLFFFGKQSDYKSFKCITLLQPSAPFILNLNLNPFALYSWRLFLDWNDTFTTTESVAGHCCVKRDRVKDLWTVIGLFIVMVILRFRNPSKHERNGGRTGGKKSIVTNSPLIVMTTSVPKRLHD